MRTVMTIISSAIVGDILHPSGVFNVHCRSCFVVDQPNLSDLFMPGSLFRHDTDDAAISMETAESAVLPKVKLKPGVKLPKCDADWNLANGYCRLHLDHSNTITDINATVEEFNFVVYKYFHDNCGPVKNTTNSELYILYGKLSTNKLKKILKDLK